MPLRFFFNVDSTARHTFTADEMLKRIFRRGFGLARKTDKVRDIYQPAAGFGGERGCDAPLAHSAIWLFGSVLALLGRAHRHAR